MLTRHISGLVTKYKLSLARATRAVCARLYVSNQGRAGARAWAWARVSARGLVSQARPFTNRRGEGKGLVKLGTFEVVLQRSAVSNRARAVM